MCLWISFDRLQLQSNNLHICYIHIDCNNQKCIPLPPKDNKLGNSYKNNCLW
ncbi:hypothetical protein RO3G_00785 [Rhizopus delemar RA 99-880]|uniref:Uncharacterized protein n=1 Tax=Rhizopus delemar (strain RA 99-880 / ATCC MYA-4621 / FGSC 9543 / NRRL 43880) TaxID=246409 RepID=I1BIQ1_RHIO9|nr:hypothetical protein RO3G_00785 [Rhizopus delemar RA 99-880]|eukprot:EIE76081.1 hypothetical protein RO3G_00785 [Rhizopus delemar RA 99-880]